MRPYKRTKKDRLVAGRSLGRWAIVESAVFRAMATLCCVAAMVAATQPAWANVTSVDDVWLDDVGGLGLHKDDELTVANEGIPTNGNSIDPFQGMMQTGYEGRPNAIGTANINFDIIVGRIGSGQLVLSGPFSVLRDQDLIIGDEGIPPGGGMDDTPVQGDGVVRIEGNGALYNNDPTILPYSIPPLTESPSVNDRPLDVGFDLYIGRAGTGSLRIALGGRAEIQDAVVVGDSFGSVGTLIVDGFDSFLSSGRFEVEPGMMDDEPHQMIIGRQGIGNMTITNGGRVLADRTVDMATSSAIIGAVIGSDPFLMGQVPEPGSIGSVVTVTGTGSQWKIVGTLQVGGFHNNETFAMMGESEGDDLEYPSNTGRGTLKVDAGALVSVVPVDLEVVTQPLDLAIGRFGRVELTGGQIIVGSNVGDPEVGTRTDQMRVLNDGVISGGGRIDTGIFRNRYLGEVEVGVGQHLVIDASATFDEPDNDAPKMVNWGVMRVFGNEDFTAELEFERGPATPNEPLQPFLNLRLTNPPTTGRNGGLIHVKHGTLRARSGIENQSVIAFTAGENLVVGDVLNMPEDSMSMTESDGLISIVGIGTHVTFENDLVNEGEFVIASEAAPVDILGNFTTTGDIGLVLELAAPPRLNVTGIASLSGALDVSLLGPSPIAGDEFNVLHATAGLTGIFTVQELPLLSTGLAWLVDYNTQTDFVKLRVLSLTGGGMGVMGADFNGDGFVDLLDLAIWNMFVGITEGATPLQGDADGDGDVDGDDFLLWQMQIGPVPGAGSGTGTGAFANVPEPCSLVLLLTSGVALLATRRRKR